MKECPRRYRNSVQSNLIANISHKIWTLDRPVEDITMQPWFPMIWTSRIPKNFDSVKLKEPDASFALGDDSGQ